MKISDLLRTLNLYNPNTEIVLCHNVGDLDNVKLSSIVNLLPVELKDKDGNLQTFVAIIDEATRADNKPASNKEDIRPSEGRTVNKATELKQ